MMRPGLMLALMITAFASEMLARPGAVRTADGKTVDGDITMSILGGISVGLSGGGTTNLAFAEVTHIEFPLTDFSAATNAVVLHSIVLRNGSALAAQIIDLSAGEFAVRANGKGFRIATLEIAAIAPPGGSLKSEALEKGRAGVALRNGDFIDGELVGADRSKVRLSTVLFGIRTIDLNKEATLVVLHSLTPTPARYEIRTADGWIYRSKAPPAFAAADALQLTDPAFGSQRVPLADILEINALTDK